MGECKNCRYWDLNDGNAMLKFGVCAKAGENDWNGEFMAWDEIQAYNPYLLTKSRFGCNQFKEKE